MPPPSPPVARLKIGSSGKVTPKICIRPPLEADALPSGS